MYINDLLNSPNNHLVCGFMETWVENTTDFLNKYPNHKITTIPAIRDSKNGHARGGMMILTSKQLKN